MQEEEEKKNSQNDPGFDLFEPVDVLSKFNSEWVEKVQGLAKWNERKQEIDNLYEALNQPKIKSGNFGDIVRMLKKLLTDSMIPVSVSSIKVCGILALKLQRDFETYIKEILSTVILRFKEKKTQFIDETHIVLDNFMLCTNLESMKDELLSTAFSEKTTSPLVKKNICIFLEKAIQKTYIDVLQRISGELLEHMMKLSDDSDGEVRSQALSVLGILKGRLGDSAMPKAMEQLVPQKIAKINEAAKIVQPSKYDKPEQKAQATA